MQKFCAPLRPSPREKTNPPRLLDVRLSPDSGHVAMTAACPLCARTGLMHRGNLRVYSITSSAQAGVVGQFDCGSRTGWKRTDSGRIFGGWRQLFNAIAAPSIDALKRSSWYRIRVTRSARFAGPRWNHGWKTPTFPHTNLLSGHGQKAGMSSHPKRPRDPNKTGR
jgi:hypothetical protein